MAQDTQETMEILHSSHCVHSLACLTFPLYMVFTLDGKKHNTTRTTALIKGK